MALLLAAGGQLKSTHWMKYAFLLRKETYFRGDDTFYDFLPYKFGPFSFTLYHERTALERDGYLTSTEDGVAIQPSNRALVAEKVGELSLTEHEAIWSVIARYGKMGYHQLLEDVYKRYPWYASRSELEEIRPSAPPRPVTARLAIYTIGYQNKSIESLLRALLQRGIGAIHDVRANAASRRYGFAKKSLSETAAKLGLRYRHFPELGIPSEFRSHLEGADSLQELLDQYESGMLPRRMADVERLIGLTEKERAVLVCFEGDPRECHRGRLAAVMSRLSGIPIEHL